jgi:preprotein translocase subunit SecA
MKAEARAIISVHARSDDPEEWDTKVMAEEIRTLHEPLGVILSEEKIRSFQEREALEKEIEGIITRTYEEKCKNADPTSVGRAESVITLRAIDLHWMDHIDDMAHLREQVAFSGYAQRDPLIEYQDQGFRRFQGLIARIDSTIVRMLLQAEFKDFSHPVIIMGEEDELPGLQTNESEIEGALLETGVSRGSLIEATDGQSAKRKAQNANNSQRPISNVHTSEQKVGRNDPCPCGSGKKYKKCHGKQA